MSEKSTETAARPAFAGDDEQGSIAMLEMLGDAFAPEGDEGGEDWGLPNVVAYLEEKLSAALFLSCEVPKRERVSPGHMRGAAQFLRDLAEAVKDRAAEMERGEGGGMREDPAAPALAAAKPALKWEEVPGSDGEVSWQAPAGPATLVIWRELGRADGSWVSDVRGLLGKQHGTAGEAMAASEEALLAEALSDIDRARGIVEALRPSERARLGGYADARTEERERIADYLESFSEALSNPAEAGVIFESAARVRFGWHLASDVERVDAADAAYRYALKRAVGALMLAGCTRVAEGLTEHGKPTLEQVVAAAFGLPVGGQRAHLHAAARRALCRLAHVAPTADTIVDVPPLGLPPLQVIDGRSERWRAAEARIAARLSDPDPADLAIVEEEQAKFDAAEAERAAPLPYPMPQPGDRVRHEDGAEGEVIGVAKAGEPSPAGGGLVPCEEGDVVVHVSGGIERVTSGVIFWKRWRIVPAQEASS
jgi:hypothetical protein